MLLGLGKIPTFGTMKKNKDIQTTGVIMAASLLLLVVFVFMWLQRVYQDTYENLKRDVDFVFINSIRDLESDMMLSSKGKNIWMILDDSCSVSQSTTDFFRGDSMGIQVNAFFSDSVYKDRSISIAVTSTGATKIEEESKQSFLSRPKDFDNSFKGLISLYSEMDVKGKRKFVSKTGDDLSLEKLVTENLIKKMVKKDVNLPPKFEVIAPDKIKVQKQLLSKKYTDVMTGQSLVMALDNFHPFIYKKMMPEIVFALFLILSVSFAFWFVYRNLIRQNRLTEVKNNLIRNITHELKTPITTVGVAIEALENFDAKDNPERQKEYLDISKYELNRLSVLVDKVLRTSLFDKKERNLNIEKIDFNDLVKGVVNSMHLQFDTAGARVRSQLSGVNFTMEGDPVHLTNVIYNLLENALKYSRGNPEIEVNLASDSNWITLTICDRGVGIPNQYLDKVFETFFRVPSGDQHNVKGHGLGLAYVADIIKKHHGKINVRNRKAGGVCFEICLNNG